MTEVNDRETLDVECTVDRVYPVDNLEFQLVSGDTAVTGSESGDITGIDSEDGAVRVSNVFSVEFRRSYSSTEQGLTCGVSHTRGDKQSERLSVIVSCELCLLF